MPDVSPGTEEHVKYHKGGSMHARGPVVDEVPEGYWEWFRLDGSKMRSGYFAAGEPVGEWNTYDRAGRVYKTSTKKPPEGSPRD